MGQESRDRVGKEERGGNDCYPCDSCAPSKGARTYRDTGTFRPDGEGGGSQGCREASTQKGPSVLSSNRACGRACMASVTAPPAATVGGGPRRTPPAPHGVCISFVVEPGTQTRRVVSGRSFPVRRLTRTPDPVPSGRRVLPTGRVLLRIIVHTGFPQVARGPSCRSEGPPREGVGGVTPGLKWNSENSTGSYR